VIIARLIRIAMAGGNAKVITALAIDKRNGESEKETDRGRNKVICRSYLFIYSSSLPFAHLLCSILKNYSTTEYFA